MPALTIEQLIDRVHDCEFNLEEAHRKLLQADGWRKTCEVGCVWLWTKEIDGKGIYLPELQAVRMVLRDYA